MVRHLVLAQPSPGEALEFGGVQRSRRHDGRGHVLAEHRVVDAEDRQVGHRRMLEQDILHCHRPHVEAADDDQVLFPLDEDEAAVGLQVPDVAGADPAVGVEDGAVASASR